MIDRIAAKEGIKMNTIQSKALIGIGECFIRLLEIGIFLLKFENFCRFNWGSANFASETAGIHQFQWRIGKN